MSLKADLVIVVEEETSDFEGFALISVSGAPGKDGMSEEDKYMAQPHQVRRIRNKVLSANSCKMILSVGELLLECNLLLPCLYFWFNTCIFCFK